MQKSQNSERLGDIQVLLQVDAKRNDTAVSSSVLGNTEKKTCSKAFLFMKIKAKL